MWRAVLIIAVLVQLPSRSWAATCEIEFRFQVTQGVGMIAPGREMQGRAAFETGASLTQEGGSVAHLASGEMTMGEEISGDVWTLITTSRDFTADLVGIYAKDVTGLSFAGIDFEGPMVITLYGPAGTMAEAVPPLSQADWDALSLRRVVTLHAHGQDMLAGDITELLADCY